MAQQNLILMTILSLSLNYIFFICSAPNVHQPSGGDLSTADSDESIREEVQKSEQEDTLIASPLSKLVPQPSALAVSPW